MKSMRVGKFRFWLMVCLMFCGLVGTAQASPAVVGAQDAGESNQPVMCWTSGPLDGGGLSGLGNQGLEGWGSDRETVVDRVGDVGGLVEELGSLKLKDPATEVGFSSFPEAIDYTFVTAGVAGIGGDTGKELGVDDVRTGLIKQLYDNPGSNFVSELPWNSWAFYAQRRPVALPAGDRVDVFRAQWRDPQNPGGGLMTDVAAMISDQQAGDADLVALTESRAGSGSRHHVESGQVPAMELHSTTTSSCSGTPGSCSYIYNLDSTLVNVDYVATTVETNNGESFTNNLDAGERPMIVDVAGVPTRQPVPLIGEDIAGNRLGSQEELARGYSIKGQPNLGDDEIHITLELNSEFREDYEWQGGQALGGTVAMRGLGAPGSVWTRDAWDVEKYRHPDLNEPVAAGTHGQEEGAAHTGYRQPSLSRAYEVEPNSFRREEIEHVKWPVNIQDVAWYLYELPGEYSVGDAWWLFWLSEEGSNRVVRGGYGKSAAPETLDPSNQRPDCTMSGEVVDPGKVACNDLPSWDSGDAVKGELDGVYFPFDTEDGVGGLSDGLLVRQGVESPVDVGGGGLRSLSLFNFSIKEGEPIGRVTEAGEGVMARYGAPLRDPGRKTYLEAWPKKSIDPNRSYLMVIAYYEAFDPHKLVNPGADFRSSGGDLRLPKRYIRRVVCRMLVSPSGYTPAGDEGRSWFRKMGDKVVEGIGRSLDVLGDWLGGILRGVLRFPGWGVKQGGALACRGLEKVDALTASPGTDRAGTRVKDWDSNVLVVNAAVRSRSEGFEDCVRVSAPVVPTCDSSTDVVFQGRCVQLPRMELSVREATFVDLGTEDEYDRWEAVPIKPNFEYGPAAVFEQVSEAREFEPSVGVDRDSRTADNVGLTRVTLDWDFLASDDVPELRRAVRGYVVYVWPDPKSSNLAEGEGRRFVLPRWAREEFDDGGGWRHYHRIDGLHVGDLYHSGSAGSNPVGSNGLVRVHHPYYADPNVPDLEALGSELVQTHYGELVALLANMPLAPGFSHRFAVAPYVGEPGYPSFVEGPISEKITLDGDEAACLTGVAGAIHPRVRELYECVGVGGVLDAGYVDDGFKVGLLGLTGTSICYDIFSSTPAEFTWDNPIVKQVWGLVWIIAGGVLFALLVWQGLRMTYDIWIEPQPSVGFRSWSRGSCCRWPWRGAASI